LEARSPRIARRDPPDDCPNSGPLHATNVIVAHWPKPDGIVKLASRPEQMLVADADALLYLPGHKRQ
jgi:hypothetical protein